MPRTLSRHPPSPAAASPSTKHAAVGVWLVLLLLGTAAHAATRGAFENSLPGQGAAASNPQGQEELRAELRQLLQELEAGRAAHDQRRELNALVYVALTYEKLRQFPEALDHYQQALKLLPAGGDVGKRAAVLYQIGDCYLSLGQLPQSLDYLNQSRTLWRQAGNQETEAQTLVQLGGLYHSLGRYTESLKSLSQARDLFKTLKKTDSEASVLAAMGSVALNHREMLLYYDEALRLWEGLHDYANQASMLDAIASFYSDLDDDKAVFYLERARAAWEQVGDRKEQAKTLLDIGLTHAWRGEGPKAVDSLNRALALWAALHDSAGQAETLTRLGWVYYWAGDWPKAETQFGDAASLWQAAGEQAKAAVALGHLGIIYARSGRKAQALEYLRKVAEAEGKLDRSHPLKALLLYDIGLIYHLTGGQRQALDYWGREVELYRDREDQQGAAEALFTLGLARETEGELLAALRLYEQALDARDKVRSAARIEEFKINLAEKSADVYQRAVLLALRLGQPARAFALSERARARAFLDQAGNIRPDIRKAGDPELLRREQALLLEMTELEKELSAQGNRPQAELSPATLSDIRRRLAEKRREYEEVLTRLKVSDPQYASLRSVETLGPEEVSKLLDAQTTLLSFFVTPEETVAFVLTRDSLQFVELRVTEQELTSAVKALRGFASREDVEAALSELHARLIPPLKRYLKTRAVCVIPHGVLHYVPFAALKDGQGYLGDEYTFFTLPSASTIALINRRGARPSKGLLALAQGRAEGLPLLRFAEREAQAAAGLYGAKPFVGTAASETVFRSEAGRNDTLLLAAHGRLDGAHPLFSQIVLAADGQNDGMLQLHEIYELDLGGVGLVVLSACETQLGARGKGDDIIALNRAFLSAGASSVVASLWRVDDEATEVLTKEFFTRLKSGDSKAAALQAAQRKTREQFPNPYYWAAFVLTGDPRAPG